MTSEGDTMIRTTIRTVAQRHAETGRGKARLRRRLTAPCVASALSAAIAFAPAVASGGSTAVLNTELAGAEETEANIVRFSVGPDWETDRHFHPGHVFVYVTEGSIEIDVEGREPRIVTPGEAIYELPDKPMIGRTASTADGAKFIVFQVGPVGEPLMVSRPE